MERHISLMLLILSLTLFPSSFLSAQCSAIGWSSDPSVNLNVSPWGANPRACTDSKGGVYISFNLNTTPFTSQWIQWVDRCGNIRWPQPVEILGEQDGTEYHPSLAADGFGGAIIAYTEWRVTNQFPFVDRGRIRVNRIDSSGTLLWGATGVRASLKDTAQYFPQVVPDGLGGAFVSVPTEDDSLFVQHISPAGQRLWGEEGIAIGSYNLYQNSHHLITDSQGGFIIEWTTLSPSLMAFFQRRNENSVLLWQDTSAVNQYYPKLAPDGNGGLVMGGIEHIAGGKRNIIANRISHVGVFVWGAEGVLIADSLINPPKIRKIIFMPDSVSVIYWTEIINFQNNTKALIQMISPDGQIFFSVGGIPPSNNPNNLISAVDATSSDNSSVIFLFVDQTAAFAQKITNNGNFLWDSSGVQFSSVPRQYILNVSDKNGGLINVGSDAPINGIFAQHINKDGNLGIPLGIYSQSEHTIAEGFVLHQNFPNPFNPITTIQFELKSISKVRLRIYNISGQLITTLINKLLLPGLYEITWDGTNKTRRPVGSGVYFYSLVSGTSKKTKKFILLR